VQAKVIQLYDNGKIKKSDLGTTIFNLVLPAGPCWSSTARARCAGWAVTTAPCTSPGGQKVTLYYSANVYSQMLSPVRQNGIVVWKQSWKNVVGTLYHELNEFRTDADVNDAIQAGDDDFLGWTSRHGHECGDQPITVADPLTEVFKLVGVKKTPVQFMFSNAVHGRRGPIAKPPRLTEGPMDDSALAIQKLRELNLVINAPRTTARPRCWSSACARRRGRAVSAARCWRSAG
jgi:hypothetical protein